MMLEKIFMPEIILGNRIKLIARNNHNYDNDYWVEIDKCRLFLREYLLWVDRNNFFQDIVSTTDMFIDLWNKGENYAYSIVLNDTDKAIGSIDIHNIDLSNHSAEIGYWLSKDYNGKGYMSEAVKLIEKQAFNSGINRMVIKAEVNNVASSRVAEKNNYVFEGIHKQEILKYDEFRDVKVYAKLKNS